MNSYGRLREKKLTNQDMDLSCQNLKGELQRELDVENRRVNIDSAKKRAVMYRMDYDGFKQMVLGAHLYQIKSKELKDFSIRAPIDKIMNPAQTTFNNVQTLGDDNQHNIERQNQEQVRLLEQVKQLQCNSFSDLRAAFKQYYLKPINQDVIENVDLLLKAQTSTNWKNIVQMDFQISYFIDMLDIFTLQLEEVEQVCFIVFLMDELSKMKEFQFQCPKFLTKSERLKLQTFMQKLKELELPQDQLKEEFYKIFESVKLFYS